MRKRILFLVLLLCLDARAQNLGWLEEDGKRMEFKAVTCSWISASGS